MPTNAEVEVMRQEIDPDGTGTFTHPKLSAMLDRRTVTIEPDEVIAAFKVLDAADSGKLSMADLKEILTNMGEKLDDGEWNKFAAKADPNASGSCDYVALTKSL
jgi:calmodulin